MKTILAPIDFSAATNGVVAAAASLARSFEGRVILLNVSQPPVVLANGGTFMFDMGDLVDRTVKDGLVKLEQLREKLAADSIKADAIQRTGHPVMLIIEEARKLKTDYILLGSHGHGAIYDLMAGSTTAGVVKRAPCPVVIVPPPRMQNRKKTAKPGRFSLPPVVPVSFDARRKAG